MKNTITIEVTNQKALRLLHELEELELIKVVKGDLVPDGMRKLSDKYRGIISKEQGRELNAHIDQLRGEWSDI